jgi:hypothetical protein
MLNIGQLIQRRIVSWCLQYILYVLTEPFSIPLCLAFGTGKERFQFDEGFFLFAEDLLEHLNIFFFQRKLFRNKVRIIGNSCYLLLQW